MSSSTAASQHVPAWDPSEPFEVFDAENRSLGRTVPRKTVHEQGLFHRSVQVLVFNSKNELLLQRRSPHKDIAPGTWDLSCSEHLQPRESYEAAARRGLNEELGIIITTTNTSNKGSDSDSDSGTSQKGDVASANGLRQVLPAFLQDNAYPHVGLTDREFVECWELHHDAPLNINPEEVTEVAWKPLAEVVDEMARHPQSYAPWLRDSMARYLKTRGSSG